MPTLSTQVVIIGAGPAGLLLGQLLYRAGIEHIVLEKRSAQYVLTRIRAGVLEHGLVQLLETAGVATRLKSEALIHQGFDIAYDQDILRIDLATLTGKNVYVYGQTEVTRDLMSARNHAQLPTYYEAENVEIKNFATMTDKPRVGFLHNGVEHDISCNFIAGCDGFHGVSRATVTDQIKVYERVYPFGWLGLLADTPPLQDELLYGNTAQGFYLCSMRSAQRSRYYLQCSVDDKVEEWQDARFWQTLKQRLPLALQDKLLIGPSLEKSIAALRSFVAEPLRFGRLFLAGDAAHIVPPSGAKGLNLAASDIYYLSQALIAFYQQHSSEGLDNYSAKALARIWKGERFSWWMSMLLHQFPTHSAFDKRMQRVEFDYLASSESAQKSFAENYVGLPYS